MRLRTSFPFLFVAGSAVACNAILDLGRFTAAQTSDGGGGSGGGSSSGSMSTLPSNLTCVTAPPETLYPATQSIQLIIADTIATMETPAELGVDGGDDLTYVSYTPQPNVTVEACGAFDPTCTSPETTPQLDSSDAGIVNLTLAGSFAGFFRCTGPLTVPFTFFPGNLLTGATSESFGTSALTYTAEQALNGALADAVILDAGSDLGEVFIVIYDCNDRHLANATLALSIAGPDTKPFYIISNVPNTTAGATDTEGVAGAINVPQGSVRATATDLATNTVIGAIDVYVSAGALTLGWIRPRTH